jgi:hypothetical protein
VHRDAQDVTIEHEPARSAAIEPQLRELVLVCIGRYPAFVFAQDLDDQAAVEPDPKIQQNQLALAKDLREHGKRGTLW